MNWFTWFVRRRQQPAELCRRCQVPLVECPRCESHWFARSCTHCALGYTCRIHFTSWST